jgi:pimeloyl-ACP methyl ester carboxylesterase
MTTRVSLSLLLLTVFVSPLPSQTGRDTVEVNGITLPYIVEGSGPPLVLIHGWAVNHHYWDGDIEAFADHYTVIRYDRRGFGDAGGKPDPTADAADLADLLKHLGHTRAHVMGHSQGASVALTFAVRYPQMVRGLVLFGPGPALADFPLPPSEHAPPIPQWIALGTQHGVDSMRAGIARWAAVAFGGGPLSPEAMERAGDMLMTYSGDDLLDPAPPLNLAPIPRGDELPSVTAPTLVIRGDQEMSFIRLVAEQLAYGIPGAQSAVVAGGGHTVNWSEPERFAAEVLRFLRTVD